MNAIEASNLVVKKSKTTILDSLVFNIKQGTITGLIGPSGSGKTTLMRSIVGVQKYGGKLDVFEYSAGSRQLRQNIGYVTQSPAIYTDLTVRQNIGYFATIASVDKIQINKIIDTVDLKAQENQLAGSLSSGQMARVSLAIALLGNPKLLVLDEPTVGLDPILRNSLWILFRNLAKSGKTLLISSHIMDEAKRCDQLLLMHEGKILWHDDKETLLKKTGTKSIEEAFITKVKEIS
jgi:ABC-2 type transport system ATP-binding protein